VCGNVFRNGRASLFNYDTPGFLRRVASKAVCVRLEKLSTETLRQHCLPASEGEEEEEQASEEEEQQAELVHRYTVTTVCYLFVSSASSSSPP
jgi:hypothetical protein